MILTQQEKEKAHRELLSDFPELASNGFVVDDVTSPYTPTYNCIAFAAGDHSQWWWPTPKTPGFRHHYWPPELGRTLFPTPENFIDAFKLLGYEECESPEHESGFQKVALYVCDKGSPTHMAVEAEPGVWFSKLGKSQDIRHHVVDALHESPQIIGYGTATYFLRRPLIN